ncbi:MAG: hypothetical protein JKY56_00645, partial [Kofleriaceae bacterium]|nr:hypothetical protein [Kofleriaceae bacterium]
MRRLGLAVAIVFLAVGTNSSVASSEVTLHAEVDPLPFALGGYGIQLGAAFSGLPGWRFGLGNFSLDVPDMSTQLNSDNDGFHLTVRHSRALY